MGRGDTEGVSGVGDKDGATEAVAVGVLKGDLVEVGIITTVFDGDSRGDNGDSRGDSKTVTMVDGDKIGVTMTVTMEFFSFVSGRSGVVPLGEGSPVETTA